MTMTVRLPIALEDRLRQASAALGRPASELVRDALRVYLVHAIEPDASAYELGKDLFGVYAGPADALFATLPDGIEIDMPAARTLATVLR